MSAVKDQNNLNDLLMRLSKTKKKNRICNISLHTGIEVEEFIVFYKNKLRMRAAAFVKIYSLLRKMNTKYLKFTYA